MIHLMRCSVKRQWTWTCTPVEKDAADIIMADGGFLGAGSHPQRSEETVHQDVELVDVPVIRHEDKVSEINGKQTSYSDLSSSHIVHVHA